MAVVALFGGVDVSDKVVGPELVDGLPLVVELTVVGGGLVGLQ